MLLARISLLKRCKRPRRTRSMQPYTSHLGAPVCTTVRSLQPTLRKCPSNQSQGLRDEQRKHQRSFEQETSILATRQVSEKDKKDQLESTKTFLDTGAFFVCLEGCLKSPSTVTEVGNFKKENPHSLAQDIQEKKRCTRKEKILSRKGKENFEEGWINSWVVMLNSKRL